MQKSFFSAHQISALMQKTVMQEFFFLHIKILHPENQKKWALVGVPSIFGGEV